MSELETAWYAECYLMLAFAWTTYLTDEMSRNIRQARRRKVALAWKVPCRPFPTAILKHSAINQHFFHITMSLALYAVLTALVAVVAYSLRNVGRRPANYPPGPPTLPIIGNLHLMPKEKPHLQFQKWAEEYGPVYSLILGTKVMVVLSSDQAVKDLLDKRSGIYSSRPDMYLGQIVSGGCRMLLMVSFFDSVD